MKKPVLLIALGGTISMQGAPGEGISPKLSGDDLAAAVPGLDAVCAISAMSPFRIPGASLTISHIVEVARIIDEIAHEFAGFVIVQGTDTIEETAFLLDCLVTSKCPIAVTGAMRGADAAGADGPANILSAATYVSSDRGSDLGTVVVFSDEVHSARLVRKADTGLSAAFTSAPYGPLGRVSEGDVILALKPAYDALKMPAPKSLIPEVALATIGFGDTGESLRALAKTNFQGAVLQGLGAGHVPETVLDAVTTLASAMPVILATRVANGPVFERTYGFAGSEIDLIGRGLIPSKSLGGPKARLLLQLALADGADHARIGDLFREL